jgi:anti-sigma factor RsiW
MKTTCGRYTEKQISRYIDEELSRQQIRQIREHLDTCPVCRDLAGQFREAAQRFTDLVALPGVSIDPGRLYQRLEQPAEKPARPRTGRFFSRPARPFLAAAASIAALFVISLYALKDNGPASTGPSAIVSSINTDYTAVMILETRDTHHTIIWYSET